MKQTDQQLTELRALADVATPGPWRTGDWGCVYGPKGQIAGTSGRDGSEKRANQALIAAAREAVPALLDDLEDTKAKLAASEQARQDACRQIATQAEMLATTEASSQDAQNDAYYCGRRESEQEVADLRQQLEQYKRDAERWQEVTDTALLKAYSCANSGKQLVGQDRALFLRHARIALSAKEKSND